METKFNQLAELINDYKKTEMLRELFNRATIKEKIEILGVMEDFLKIDPKLPTI